jgi:tetratricopeptide (TPR) repeat protein
VFEGKNAHHMEDSCLAFVLLVGDNYNNNSEGMPTSFNHNVMSGDSWDSGPFPADYYFTCITKNAAGEYSDMGSLCIGRFSVENDEQLFNMVHKTINHETLSSDDESWRKKAAHIYGWTYGSATQSYENTISNLLDEIEWTGYIVDTEQIKEPTLNYWNEGVVYSFYTYPGGAFSPTTWEDNLNVNAIASELDNGYMAPFIFCHAHRSGWFDDTDCFAEYITRYDSVKGAVGYIGASRAAGSMWSTFDINSLLFHEAIPYFLFAKNDINHTPIAGELLWAAKILSDQLHTNNLKAKYAYNYFGDPALNILAEPSNGCRMYVSTQTPVINYQYIVPDDCILYLHQDGKLIIEEGGSLILGNRVQVIGINNEIEDAIHVKGGEFIVGENVTFQDLIGGILLENTQSETNPSFFDENLEYSIRDVAFDNTPLTHLGTRLNISNCTFNPGSNLKTSVSKLNVDSCIFNQSTVFAEHSVDGSIGIPIINIGNSHFTGNNSTSAIHLNYVSLYQINNNTIKEYETGISLHTSGLTQSQSYWSCAVVNNKVSSCTVGIETFNSVATFVGNQIYENVYGVRLYNHSASRFVGEEALQIIRDNDSYELYACANSFPEHFAYNHIIDDDNLGNNFDDPMIYWDVSGRVIRRDVNFNCWGVNFDPLEDLYPPYAFICDSILPCSGKSGSPIRGNDEILYQTGLDYFANEDYGNAETTFKELIETYSQSRFAIAALRELFALEHYQYQGFGILRNYFASFTEEDSVLFNTADFLATRCHVKDRNWQPAINWYEDRIENPPSYQDSVFAVIDLGDIHLMMEADTMGGAKSGSAHYRLSNIKPKSKQAYEENKAILLATLPQIKKPQTENPHTPNLIPHPDKKGALGQNIPNPTSGITTINYEIYTEGMVDVFIYNTMGQLVKSLPQGTLAEGKYQAKITVSNMPAGMYHYALFVNGEMVDSKKMIVN